MVEPSAANELPPPESDNESDNVGEASKSTVLHRISMDELDDIAKKLLRGKFFLAALEFHAELVEVGRELPRLKDFFSNPGNFEIQSKLDPLQSVSKFKFFVYYILLC